MGGLLRGQGYLRIKDYGQLLTSETTTKDVTVGFGYSNESDGSGLSGLFISEANGQARFQLKSDINRKILKYRQTNYNDIDITGWVNIKLDV